MTTNKHVQVRLKEPQGIIGPSSVCFGEIHSFTASIPFNEEYCNFHHEFEWEVPNNWQILSENNVMINDVSYSTIQVQTPLSGNSGSNYLRVKAYIPTLGHSEARSKMVYLGNNTLTNLTAMDISDNMVCSNQEVHFYLTLVPDGATNYQWSWDSNWEWHMGGINTPSINLISPSFQLWTMGWVSVTFDMGCGSEERTLWMYEKTYDCGYWYSVYPNPAENEFEVLIESDTNESNASMQAEFYLFNDKMQKVRELKSFTRKTKINIQGLPQGAYILHIFHNKEKIIKQIVIK